MYLLRQRGTNDFLCISESHLGSSYMSFRSEVVITRFNERREEHNSGDQPFYQISPRRHHLQLPLLCINEELTELS